MTGPFLFVAGAHAQSLARLGFRELVGVTLSNIGEYAAGGPLFVVQEYWRKEI